MENYKNCLESTQLNKINYIEKNKINTVLRNDKSILKA